MEEKDDLQIIGQGTYGCVFRPNIECSKKNLGDPSFLSKIQKSDKTMRNEIEIGKRLPKSIRFAGIVETCPITVGKIGKEGVEKCKMLQKNKKMHLVSNKIKYAGKETISEYLENIIKTDKNTEKNSEKYIKEVINTHLYLLESLVVLNTSNVLHLDMKYNNIMMREKRPVIIDYGLSFAKDLLNIDKYKLKKSKNPFGIAVNYYIPWCFEVILLSHVSRNLSITDKDGNIKLLIDEEKERKNLDEKEKTTLTVILNRYIEENTVLKMSIFTSDERTKYKEKMKKWIEELKTKSWREIWNTLISTSNTWDNYGLSVMYLMELDISGLLQLSKSETEGFLKNYVKELKVTILSTPNERKLPENTKTVLSKIFSRIKKTDHKERVAQFSLLLKDNGNRKKMSEARTIAETDGIIKKELLRKNA